VVLRPDALDLTPAGEENAWHGEVVNRRFTGGSAVYKVKLSDNITVEVASQNMQLREGDAAGVKVVREPLPVVYG
ncbi:MAG: TOBE domain-containing protein, partial [Gemmatimonadaceae bacterium]|nr:TOBE domain-containing protein [Gemmatimonadaceae bacterium]